MPYAKLSDLPPAVKDNLPKHGQEIYMAAYNSAAEKHDDEATRAKIAWAAVKNSYTQDADGKWIEKAKEGEVMPDKDAQAEALRVQEEEPVREAKPYEKREHVEEWFPARDVEGREDGDHRIEFVCHGLTSDKTRYYPKRALEAAAADGIFDGAKMFLNHGNPPADKARGHRDLREWGATILPDTVKVNEAGNLEAVCHAHTAEALAILNDPVASKAVGLSHDSFIRTTAGTINGKPVRTVEAIEQNMSVDFVPSGNAFGRVLETTPLEEVPEMALETLTLEQLREARPELVKQIEDAQAAVTEAAKEAKPEPVAEVKPVAPEPVAETVSKLDFDAVTKRLADVETARATETCAVIVGQVVDATEGLGTAGRKRVKELFAGQIIPATEIHAKVKEAADAEKAYQLELLREAGVRTKVSGAGGAPGSDGTEQTRESYKAEHEQWLRDRGVSEDEIKAQMA